MKRNFLDAGERQTLKSFFFSLKCLHYGERGEFNVSDVLMKHFQLLKQTNFFSFPFPFFRERELMGILCLEYHKAKEFFKAFQFSFSAFQFSRALHLSNRFNLCLCENEASRKGTKNGNYNKLFLHFFS